MKKRLLFGAVYLIIVAVITVVILYGKSRIIVPKLELSEKSWDFGAVKTGSDVKHTIIIKNMGRTELTLYAYPSCPACMFLEFEKYNVPPKGETKLHVKIVETKAGPYEGSIRIESNDPSQLVKMFVVKGKFVEPGIEPGHEK